MRSPVTWVGLAVVALAAAALSLASLISLARMCGTPFPLACLLPVCLDAAAAVATLVWLSASTPPAARSYARALALAMMGLSVAGNTADHMLTAYRLTPPWWLLIAVAAVPPTVLGAVGHLAALARTGAGPAAVPVDGDQAVTDTSVSVTDDVVDEHRARLAMMITDAQRVRYAVTVTGCDRPVEVAEWLADRGHPVNPEAARSALRRGRPDPIADDQPTRVLHAVGAERAAP